MFDSKKLWFSINIRYLIIIHLLCVECSQFFSSSWNLAFCHACKGELVFAPKPPNKTILCVSSFNPLTNMSFSITCFHLFFGLPFFEPSTTNFFDFTGALLSSILSTCSNHHNLSLFSQELLYLPYCHLTNYFITDASLVFFHKSYLTFSFQ